MCIILMLFMCIITSKSLIVFTEPVHMVLSVILILTTVLTPNLVLNKRRSFVGRPLTPFRFLGTFRVLVTWALETCSIRKLLVLESLWALEVLGPLVTFQVLWSQGTLFLESLSFLVQT